MRVCGWMVSGAVVACVAVPAQAAPLYSRGSDTKTTAAVGSAAPDQVPDAALRTAGDLEPLRLPAFIPGQDDRIRLHETSGQPVTVRVTPVDEQGSPVDGGRVIVLRANETRVVRLTDTLVLEDLIGRRLVVETLRGSGEAAIEATWLTPAEEEAVAATAHVPRRHLTGVTPPTSEQLIDQAETAGTLNHETAVLYRVYAIFGDARLPQAYRGDDASVFESLYVSTVVSEWATYSAATQTALKPFLMPPPYRGSWATAQGGIHGLSDVHALDSPPFCAFTSISAVWTFTENPNGKVRVWYRTTDNDAALAASFATAADTTIWSTYTGFMGTHAPPSDAGVSCDGGNGRLDVYISDIPRPETVGHLGCSDSPAYIEIGRGETVMMLAHEVFHAFQYSFQVGGCLTDAAYRWWTEGSATWAEQYIYPNDPNALDQGRRLVNTPEQSLDSVRTDIERAYGTFLVPFYVQNKSGSPDFVRTAWENCKTQDAIHAVDAAIPGGFAQTWHEIALRDFNVKPVNDYKIWRPLITYHANPQRNDTIAAGVGPDSEVALHMNLAHLSATYQNFFFYGPEISSVAFFNGATFNLQKMDVASYGPYWNPQTADANKTKGVKVQAIVKIEGQDARVEDWTDKPYVTFCRDATDERLQQLTIVISNARLDDSDGNAVPPGLAPVMWFSNMGCYQWTGSTHYQATGQVSGSQFDAVNDVVWTRVSGSHPPPETLYQATGHIDVTVGNLCSGGGTVTITPASSSLTTYNFTPADATGRRAYQGYSAEFQTVPVVCSGKPGVTFAGAWFNVLPANPPSPPPYKVSADGKHMSANFKDSTGNIQWSWDLTAQRQ